MNQAILNMKHQINKLPSNTAAGRKRWNILSEVLASSTREFLERIHFQNGMKGLDMGCGTGEVTLQLATMVGTKGKVTGIDRDATSIKIAQEKAARKNKTNVDFIQKDIFEWKDSAGAYDFVYSRLFLNQLSQPLAALQKVHQSLKTGGMAMVEDMDFSNYYCYPNCYAFDRYLELFIEIKKRQGTDANIGNKLFSLFQQAGFQKVKVQLIPPTFLNLNHKPIASLTLENSSDILLQEELTTSTELQALLFELKAFENRQDTLITLPGIYQAWGYKR